jgi:hypothetical protein
MRAPSAEDLERAEEFWGRYQRLLEGEEGVYPVIGWGCLAEAERCALAVALWEWVEGEVGKALGEL